MKYLQVLSLIFVALVFSANKCYRKDDINNRIMVINNLPFDIYVVPLFNYPDTTLNDLTKEKIVANHNSYFIAHGKESRITVISLCNSIEWQRVALKDTAYLFVFKELTIKNTEWQEIKNNYLIHKRILLTHSMLINANCTIQIE